MRILAVCVLSSLIALGGCATSAGTRNQENYQAYLNTVKDIEVNKSASNAAALQVSNSDYDQLLAKCSSDSCVASVASYKTIANVVASMAAQNSGNSFANIQAPQREASWDEKMLAWAGVMVPGATQMMSIHESNKTQRAISKDNVTLQTAQVNAWANALGTVASTPSISVGGNYGDTYGNGYTGGDRSEVNNSGTLVSGNNNRVASPSIGGAGGNCNGGNGAPGGAAGAGGSATTGTGGPAGNAGNGAQGGNGGNCSGGAGN